jgi:rhomboid family GlyGly-CTERM serine protease
MIAPPAVLHRNGLGAPDAPESRHQGRSSGLRMQDLSLLFIPIFPCAAPQRLSAFLELSTRPVPPVSPISRLPWATAFVVGLALAAHLWPLAWRWLVFERDQVVDGEWWRLWTAHFTHLGTAHFLSNLAVFIPAGVWSERLVPWRTRLLYLITPAAVGLALYLLDPALQRYAGLSGVTAATLALLAFTQLSRPFAAGHGFWWAVLALVGIKIAIEFVVQQPAFSPVSDWIFVPVPLAHTVGIACAALVHVSHLRFARQRQP